ncbi:MAG TPA: carboxypeptidase-like regulatory domain-containing protein, partial [Chryseosolibacter sp.]
MKHNYSHKLLAVLILAFSVAHFAGAQTTVTGKVTSAEDGAPIPGVNIIVKNTVSGTVTDAEGIYRISINEDDILVFSSIGFATQEVAVGGRSVIDIVMAPDIQSLSEVVIVGYGSQRKADITSAVSVIDLDNIGDVPASNVSRLLQGQAAGVQVRQTTGTPGAEMEVTIRGIGSLGAGSQPLYVVDGFP